MPEPLHRFTYNKYKSFKEVIVALVKYGVGIAEMRGSIGGVTFSKSYCGPIVKEKPYPVRRMRGFQPNRRSLVGFLSRRWGALTDAQRQEWKTWALNHPEPDKFGGTFIMSGINAFVKLNMVAMYLFGTAAYLVTPPEDPPAASLYSLTVATGATNPGEIDLTWTHNGTGDANDKNEIRIAGPFQSPGLVEVHNQFKYLATVAGNLLTYTAASLVEGFWYWFQVRYVDQYGQVTAFLTGQATPKLTP